jgi:hypothetical protein
MDPDIRRQHISSQLNSDLTTSTMTISFDQTTTIDRIAILEFNAKKFNIYYNGATANAFSLTSPTTTSQWTTNAVENLNLACTPVAVTSVTFDFYSTQVANQEKAIGYIYVGANQLTFPRIPSSKNYTPMRDPKEFIHELSDGGTRRQSVQTKWSTKIKLSYITESFRDSLKTIYELNEPVTYVPFGTGTAWDGILFEAVWSGNFEFYKYSDDATESGFSGGIDLKES